MWFCGIILACKIGLKSAYDRIFSGGFGRFFGGILRTHDYRVLPSLWFFVWIIYALCKAYRKLASEYHPDKIQSKDLLEAFIIFANEKLKEINHAHEMIVKSRKEEKI